MTTPTATAADAIPVWFDGTLIIDAWTDQAPTTHEAFVPDVTAGDHTIKVEYYEGTGGAVAKVSWSAAT